MFRPLAITLVAAACSGALAQTNDPVRPREGVATPPPGPVSSNPASMNTLGSTVGQSPYYVGIQQAFARESNPGLAVPGEPVQPDTFSTTTLRAGINQPISRQRLFGDAELRYRRYSKRDALSGSGYTLNAGWDFATVERISGTLGANFNRDRPLGIASTSLGSSGGISIGPSGDEVGIATSEELRGVVRIGGTTPLTLEAGADHRQVSYSKLTSADYKQPRAHVTAMYRLSSATTLGLGTALSSPKYVDDKGKRSDIYLQGSWIASAISDIQGRLAYTKFTRDLKTFYDYKGVSGSMTLNWRPTGKVAVSTILARDTGQDLGFRRLTPQFSVAAAEFSTVTNLLSVRSTYEATAKIFVDTGIAFTRASTFNELANVPGTRASTVFSLGARWLPTRNVTVGCQYSRDYQNNKTENLAGVSFVRRPENGVFGCLGAYTFF